MKKAGILNTRLSEVVAALGHTDRLVVCDSGLPIPRQAEVIDLALTRNVPRFIEVLEVILQEFAVEGAIVATEMERKNAPLFKNVQALLAGVRIGKVAHEKFKEITRRPMTTVFVKTGEATPYANIILVAGVTF